MAQRVRFLGPQPAVERFYAAGRVLALPTVYDPCSNVVLEALAGGLPVVTTAANGASEFIRPGDNGAILARPDDCQDLAAALDEYLERATDPAVQQSRHGRSSRPLLAPDRGRDPGGFGGGGGV